MSPSLRRFLLCCLAFGLLLSGLPGSSQETNGDSPRKTDIIEQTGRRLAQLDVTVLGPDEEIADLGAADFELSVGGKVISEFIVDRTCRPVTPLADGAPGEPTSTEPTPAAATPAAALGPKPTYLLYFDQHHLTGPGRL
jgi:hypothetical protein